MASVPADLPDSALAFGEPRARWVLAPTVLGSGLAFVDTTAVNVCGVASNVETLITARAPSGVNNAVARIGGLLANAILPVIAGLGGQGYSNPILLEPAYRTAMWACALLLAAGGVLAAVFVHPAGPKPTPVALPRVEPRWSCDVGGPPLHGCPRNWLRPLTESMSTRRCGRCR